MTTIKDAASEFLSRERVAVTGVSRTPGKHGSTSGCTEAPGREASPRLRPSSGGSEGSA
jgi:hypothetical protein